MGVRLSEDEVWAELARAHTGILTTLRRDGMPVSLPTWFVVSDQRVYVRTMESTKKVAHVERDPRATFLVERGERWAELCAVMLTTRVVLHRDGDVLTRVLDALDEKYAAYRTASVAMPDASREHYADPAVVLELVPTGAPVTWDNSKLRLR
jgi:PPOX class probable F420-dependent enzyme